MVNQSKGTQLIQRPVGKVSTSKDGTRVGNNCIPKGASYSGKVEHKESVVVSRNGAVKHTTVSKRTLKIKPQNKQIKKSKK